MEIKLTGDEKSLLKKKKKAKKTAPLPEKGRRKKAGIEFPVRDEIGLEATDSLAEGGRKVLSFLFGRMLTHEPGTRLGSDIEALHDMRVATRRMRAAFRVFGSGFKRKAVKPLLAGLRATGRALGRVRDLDVLLEKLQQYQAGLPENEGAGLQVLVETWSAQREEARQEMMAYLDSKKYLHFKQDFLKFVTTEGLGAKAIATDAPTPYQLRHVAPGLIYDRYEAVHAYETVLPHASLETLHQLRITFKSLRYTLEFMDEILGEESQWVIDEVKMLQDHLGELNDAEVASNLLRDLLAEWNKSQAWPPLARQQSSLTAYLESRLAERQRLLETFPEAWERFNQPDFRRNLALAVSVL
ncbi:MAG: CHAD domain-containing protein [Anaerolineae bacterium]